MAYTINLTDGTIFATVADGTINSASTMTLVGKNYAGYGQFLDENFIHLLENSSDTAAPGAPLEGQLWWDQGNSLLKVYNGSTFKTISAATSGPTAPVSNVVGDLWFDTTNSQLKVWTGASFLVVGPAYTAATGTTGAIVTTIIDNISVSHVVVELYVENAIVGIISKDTVFTPGSSIPGFTTVRPGITLATTISGVPQLFQGTATDSQLLDGLDSTQFLRSDANDDTSGTLKVLNDGGFFVGADQDFKVSVTGTAVTVANQTSNGNLILNVNIAGTPTNAMLINGSSGIVNIPASLATVGNVSGGNLISAGAGIFGTTVTASGNVNGGNIVTSGAGSFGTTVTAFGDITAANFVTAGVASVTAITKTGANAVGNIGSAGNYFNQVFATSSSALYADVAERFAADTEMEPGTIVELGGSHEITRSNTDLSENVLGVISTRAAYLMNSGAGDNLTHPAIAMTGRVPVRVIGTVAKGDRLVSAGNGIARAAKPGEATAFNVIGRSLVDKNTTDEGAVEAIVTIK